MCFNIRCAMLNILKLPSPKTIHHFFLKFRKLWVALINWPDLGGNFKIITKLLCLGNIVLNIPKNMTKTWTKFCKNFSLSKETLTIITANYSDLKPSYEKSNIDQDWVQFRIKITSERFYALKRCIRMSTYDAVFSAIRVPRNRISTLGRFCIFSIT